MNVFAFEKWISRIDYPVNVLFFLFGLFVFRWLGVKSSYLLIGLLLAFGLISLASKNLLRLETRLRAESEVTGGVNDLNRARVLYLYSFFLARASVGLLMAYVILIGFHQI